MDEREPDCYAPNVALRLALERVPGDASLIDVLDRILDKGIVVDASVRATFLRIDLITSGARVVVAGVKTHLEHVEAPRTGVVLHSDANRPQQPLSLAESLGTTGAMGWPFPPKRDE